MRQQVFYPVDSRKYGLVSLSQVRRFHQTTDYYEDHFWHNLLHRVVVRQAAIYPDRLILLLQLPDNYFALSNSVIDRAMDRHY